jgi:3D (Asp-Asp-Asp) domain-containing protein
MIIRPMMNTLRASVTRLAKIIKKSPTDIAVIVILSFAVLGTVLPANASATLGKTSAQDRVLALEIEAMQNINAKTGTLAVADLVEVPDRTLKVSMTAYNSLPEQTDSNPFETAMGTTTRRGIVAANFVPLGTYIKIPELYGDEIFIVEDRMNARYTNRVDIWMEHYSDARQFGVKRNVTVEVYYEKE